MQNLLTYIGGSIKSKKESIPNKKLALIIGINYEFDSKKKLKGCINDSMNIIDLLKKKFNYDKKNIYLLCDYGKIKPTKENILLKIKEIINKLEENDKMFFYFSGHSMKHGLVTYDLNYLYDYEIKKSLVNKIPENVQLFGLIDSCYSENKFILPYHYLNNNWFNYKSYFMFLKKPKGNVIMISSCNKKQKSIDCYNIENKIYEGVVTNLFIKILKNKIVSWRNLMILLKNDLINNGYILEPQLTSSSKIDINNIIYL